MSSKIKYLRLPALTLLCCLFSFCVHENDGTGALALTGDDQALQGLLNPLEEPHAPVESDRDGVITPDMTIRPANRNADDDDDLLTNGLEYDLIRKFAPFYYLYSQEKEHTSSVDWVLEKAGSLRFSKRTGINYQEYIVPGGPITMENLGNFRFTTTHQGRQRTYRSDAWYDIEKEGSFHMYFGPGRTRGGNLAGTRCYAVARISADPGVLYEVQYHWFYPYNPSRFLRAGTHAGDWENVTVRVNNNLKVHSVVFYGHGKPHVYYPNQKDIAGRGLVLDKATGGNRPNVHSAYKSHASYPTAGKWKYSISPIRDKTNFGPRIDCRKRFVNIGNRSRPSKGNGWIKYLNKWGSRYGISSVGWHFWSKRDWSREGVLKTPPPIHFRSNETSRYFDVSIKSDTTKLPSFRLTGATMNGLYKANIRVIAKNIARVTVPNRPGIKGEHYASLRVNYEANGRKFSRTGYVEVVYSSASGGGCGGPAKYARIARCD